MTISLMMGLAIVLVFAAVSLMICRVLKIPSIIGFLITGVLASQTGLDIFETSKIDAIAEIGIILLLFTIGIEFSLKKIIQVKKVMIIGGFAQVVLTAIVTSFFARLSGFNLDASIFIGLVLSLSSTAIVLKILHERSEINTPHGKTSLAILIFQDVIVILMMLIVPFLAGESSRLGDSMLYLGLKGVGLIAFVMISSRWIVPELLFKVAKTRNKELFLIIVTLLCFATAILTEEIGLSLGLGAFLAGLIISESEYGYETIGKVVPFKDVFLSIFFISIGMLLDVKELISNPLLIIGLTISIMAGKAIIATFSALILKVPLRSAIMTGLALSQIGEFSFILSGIGVSYGIIDPGTNSILFASIILSMTFSPYIMSKSTDISNALLKIPWPKRIKTGFSGIEKKASDKKKRSHNNRGLWFSR